MRTLAAVLILVASCYWSPIKAQNAESWIEVSPPSEQFTIKLPQDYSAKSTQNASAGLAIQARVYTATSNGVDYVLWSLVNENYPAKGASDDEVYLDACADLVWHSLLKPWRERVSKSDQPHSRMSYEGELQPGKLPGREYTLKLGEQLGLTHFYVAGRQIYVLTVLNADADSAGARRFLGSFSLGMKAPPLSSKESKLSPAHGAGGGIFPGPGRSGGGRDRIGPGNQPSTAAGESTDYNRIFSGGELTKKVRVLSKPEPSYSENARQYSVQGSIILRAVFARSGEVTIVRVIKRLPHGLTERAIAAAKQIKFVPGVKDGHDVSTYIQLEYNFHLY